jgi:uncharacterized protein (TIGR02996 family)
MALAFRRLLGLLSLSNEERGFVQAALEQPEDVTIPLIFADWLEERGRCEEAEKFREAAKP